MSSCTNNQNEKNKETFENTYGSMYSIFHLILAIFAIYLSFKCNHGFELPHFLLACCCPIPYIIYQFVVSPTFCELRGLPSPVSR